MTKFCDCVTQKCRKTTFCHSYGVLFRGEITMSGSLMVLTNIFSLIRVLRMAFAQKPDSMDLYRRKTHEILKTIAKRVRQN